jgi:hypothetical protein
MPFNGNPCELRFDAVSRQKRDDTRWKTSSSEVAGLLGALGRQYLHRGESSSGPASTSKKTAYAEALLVAAITFNSGPGWGVNPTGR